MPGQFVFVPLDPKEAEEECASRQHVAGRAKQELARGRLFAGKIDDAQAAQHHPRRGAAEDGEESEILQVDDGERDGVDGGVELAECEVSAKRPEESEKTPAGEKEAGRVDQTREAALLDRGDWILADLLLHRRGLWLRGLLRLEGPSFLADGKRDVNEHLCFIGGPGIGGSADGNGERKVVGRGGRLFCNGHIDAGHGNFSAFERQLGLALVGRAFAAARTVGGEALRDFAAPGRIAVGVRR